MKTYTNKEQSKKLVELGIDVNTADMWYPPSLIKYGVVNEWWENPTIIKDIEHSKLKKEYHIPCWSLSALLDLIPPYLGEFNDGIDFGFGKAMNGKWYSAHYLQTYPNGDIKSVKTITGDTAVDAAFEMVCWLKENNIL